MFVRYNYKLKPDEMQQEFFKKCSGASRWVWNHFLSKEIETYQETNKFNFYFSNAKSLPFMKKEGETEWLKEVPSQTLQESLRDLDAALKQSFKKQKNRIGFPRFKKKKEFEGSFRICQTPKLWKYGRKGITLPKIGFVKWNLHRKIPSEFSTVTIFQDGKNWYISIVVSLECKGPVSIESHEQIVGLDLNSKMLVISSDGEIFDNPKFLKRIRKKLKRKQRQLSKRKRCSNRYKRKQSQLRKIHSKIKNQRKDNLHKISSQITNDYDLICLEDLNVKGIQRFNGNIVEDCGWSMLVNQLEYKSRLNGKHIQKIDRFAPSSKTCNHCGHVQTMNLSDRVYECDFCHSVADRDLNAAFNIRDWGLMDFLNQQNTTGTAGIHGRGDTSIGEMKVPFKSRYVSLNRQKFLSSRKEAVQFIFTVVHFHKNF